MNCGRRLWGILLLLCRPLFCYFLVPQQKETQPGFDTGPLGFLSNQTPQVAKPPSPSRQAEMTPAGCATSRVKNRLSCLSLGARRARAPWRPSFQRAGGASSKTCRPPSPPAASCKKYGVLRARPVGLRAPILQNSWICNEAFSNISRLRLVATTGFWWLGGHFARGLWVAGGPK